jgi:hypothetical protein
MASCRVGDVGLATVAHLAQMGLVGKTVGAAHQLDIVWRQVIQLAFERGKAGGDTGPADDHGDGFKKVGDGEGAVEDAQADGADLAGVG